MTFRWVATAIPVSSFFHSPWSVQFNNLFVKPFRSSKHPLTGVYSFHWWDWLSCRLIWNFIFSLLVYRLPLLSVRWLRWAVHVFQTVVDYTFLLSKCLLKHRRDRLEFIWQPLGRSTALGPSHSWIEGGSLNFCYTSDCFLACLIVCLLLLAWEISLNTLIGSLNQFTDSGPI